MNQNAVDYLNQNKDKFGKDVLVDQLRKSNYSEAEIQEAVAAVYSQQDANTLAATAYAGFWIRFVAFLLDEIIVAIGILLLGLAINLSVGLELGSALFSFLAVILAWAYFICMTKRHGATLGKQMFGLKVLSANGQPLGLGQLALREIVGRIVNQITLSIGYIIAAFTAKKQGLHDIIAGTLVVHSDPGSKKKSLAAVLIILVALTLVIIGIFVFVFFVAVSRWNQAAI